MARQSTPYGRRRGALGGRGLVAIQTRSSGSPAPVARFLGRSKGGCNAGEARDALGGEKTARAQSAGGAFHHTYTVIVPHTYMVWWLPGHLVAHGFERLGGLSSGAHGLPLG
jgi:hypothetical protein